VREAVRAEHLDWRDRLIGAALRDPRPARAIAWLLEMDGWVPMHWETLGPLGIRRCTPFRSRSVYELCFECHPSELVGPGTKKLLRRAVNGLVPSRNLMRPDKGTFVRPGREPLLPWRGEIPESLHSLFEPGWISAPPERISRRERESLRMLINFANDVRSLYHGARAGEPRSSTAPAIAELGWRR
jgi:hypothetical protein